MTKTTLAKELMKKKRIIYRKAGNEECHQYIFAAYEDHRRK